MPLTDKERTEISRALSNPLRLYFPPIDLNVCDIAFY